MNQLIIYTQDNGTVAIICPTEEYLQSHTIEDCLKDVPEGKAYKIIDATDIPTDRTFRNAWEMTV
jgi:hypothetical protein